MWALIEPLLPPRPERSPGPRPVSDQLCLQGILFVLYNDIAWQLLPLELGFGSGQTCWRRLDRWRKSGAFDRLHRVLLAELNAAGELDLVACVRGRFPHPREKVPLWFSSSRRGSRCLVESAVAEHGKEHVHATSGEGDQGRNVVIPFAALLVVVAA